MEVQKMLTDAIEKALKPSVESLKISERNGQGIQETLPRRSLRKHVHVENQHEVASKKEKPSNPKRLKIEITKASQSKKKVTYVQKPNKVDNFLKPNKVDNFQMPKNEQQILPSQQQLPYPPLPTTNNPDGQIGVPPLPFPPDEQELKTAGEQALKPNELNQEKKKIEICRGCEDEHEKANYQNLVALDDVDLVGNAEPFECPVCFVEVAPGEGAVLHECLHSFCRQCLADSIQYSVTAVIKCSFANKDYKCESLLEEREIKCLVTPDMYEKHLARSLALAESQARDSFHCKTPDCTGWCLFDGNVNMFVCPVCKRTNCVTCGVVHEGINCRQYQDWLAQLEEAKKTREYLKDVVTSGEAMECPGCKVILTKIAGCDWLKCSLCHTEVCWATRGPRWGPQGHGDTSGGCKCKQNGVRCHPNCGYCH